MNILGYIVQSFHEDKLLPESGFKKLYTVFNQALLNAKYIAQDYLSSVQEEGPYELTFPTKKETDENGYSLVFQDGEFHLWIEVVVE